MHFDDLTVERLTLEWVFGLRENGRKCGKFD